MTVGGINLGKMGEMGLENTGMQMKRIERIKTDSWKEMQDHRRCRLNRLNGFFLGCKKNEGTLMRRIERPFDRLALRRLRLVQWKAGEVWCFVQGCFLKTPITNSLWKDMVSLMADASAYAAGWWACRTINRNISAVCIWKNRIWKVRDTDKILYGEK